MSKLYNKIFNAIPLYIGETFIENEIREEIAKNIDLALNDGCEHDFMSVSQVKIFYPHVCKKCGKME